MKVQDSKAMFGALSRLRNETAIQAALEEFSGMIQGSGEAVLNNADKAMA